jgi:uncharacterized membrane protein
MKKQISKVLFESSKNVTDAMLERGGKQLLRLSILIDVLFALMIYKLFMFLPRPEIDGFSKDDLVEVLSTSYLNYLMMLVGFVMILIYWGQSNLQFGNLDRTDGKHASLSILQVISLFIYLYFVRLDVEFDGTIIALQMESVFLAISGFFGVWSWHYAVKNGLTTKSIVNTEKTGVYLKLLPEPIVSVLSFPFAFFGADIWTLSWLLLLPVGWILKKYRHRLYTAQITKED